ncbi:MAG: hypothetical protein RBT76_05460 [candidate division Zixibacteria bacterium]|jgi:hypothetical protein|nr:hypothetical protein [candidate division Zixibacteria bacterium]
MVKIVITCLAFFACAAPLSAQVTADSSRVPVDTAAVPTDTARDAVPPRPDTTRSDTLTDVEKAQQRFEERYRQAQQEREQERPYVLPVSYFDSLAGYFAPRRLDMREVIDRSFYHDAGDYFRFSPGFFLVDRQVTPMRKTVQPYTLAGNRLNVLHDGTQLHPFEHTIEPDGLVDMNDIPTALDGHVFVLHGPSGALFGGRQGVASLLTLPQRYDDYDAHSAFLVDKGSYGYSYARARYQRRFEDGRDLGFSIGYRLADGPYFQTSDDVYHYTGDFYIPLSGKVALLAQGRLYNRDGPLRIEPDISGAVVQRDRFDRSGEAGVQINDGDGNGNWQARFRYQRGSSDVSGVYLGRFNQTGHGAALVREWADSTRAVRLEATVDRLTYDEGSSAYERTEAGAFGNIADLSDGWRYAVRAGALWDDEYDLLPSASATLIRESRALLVMLSAGYIVRQPSLHELHLPFRRATIYPLGTLNYADRGTDSLSEETQITGSATVRWGTDRISMTLTGTGGKILDGIDWKQTSEVIDGNLTRVFSPINGDIDFASVSVEPSLKIWDLIRFSAGGAYHYTSYAAYEGETRPYAPDYQFWAGGELHVYWPQKLIHLFAYGEIVYTSSYDGYYELNLGQDPVFNARLSLQMGRFRFHFIFQNVLNRVYQSRENSSFLGRFNSYGFTWNFLN